MADSSLGSKKSSPRFFAGSLARRAVTIAFAFLVIPLIAYAFIIYKYEYREREKDLFDNLKLFTSEKQDLIDEFAHEEFDFLQVIQYFVEKDQVPDDQLNSFLKDAVKNKPKAEIFYLTVEGQKLICTASSDPNLMRKDFSGYDIQKFYQKKMRHLFSRDGRVVFSMPISSSRSINLELPIQHFFEKIPLLHINFPELTIAVLNEKGKVLASNVSEIVGKNILEEEKFQPIAGMSDGYRIRINGSERFAIKMPIKRSSLSILVAAKEKWIFNKYFSHLYRIGIFFLFIIVIGGLATLLTTLRISKPLKKLRFTMQQVGQGDLSARFQEDRMGFEINVLGKIFNKMVESLTHHIEEAKELETQKETFKKELLIGHEVQKSILPKEIPDFPGLDIATGFLSAKEVGGDFYDILKNPKGQLVFSVADTSGKGVFACFYSLVLRSILRSFAIKTTNLNEIITSANNLFCKDTGDSGVFVTAWLGIYDAESRTLTFASQGHYPGLLKRADGTLEKLGTQGMALGVQYLEKITLSSVTLAEGDILLLFTDGVIDAFNSDQQRYSEARLEKILQKEKREKASQYINDILDDVFAFSVGEAQYDDITLFTLKVETST